MRDYKNLSFRINSVPSDDPVAFLFGFSRGLAGETLEDPEGDGEELAPAVIEGYELGKKIKDGDEEMPDWADTDGIEEQEKGG
tara:strand:- start:288 stop:536 length:249 start_codon:yes stop_codon:yes gene_type:complete